MTMWRLLASVPNMFFFNWRIRLKATLQSLSCFVTLTFTRNGRFLGFGRLHCDYHYISIDCTNYIYSVMVDRQGKVLYPLLDAGHAARGDPDWNLLGVRAQHVPALLPVTPLQIDRISQTLCSTIPPLCIWNHSAHISKYTPLEWLLLLLLLWMRNCLHRAHPLL